MRWNRSVAQVSLLGACLTMILSACGTATVTATTPATIAPTSTTSATAAPLPTVDTASAPATCKDMPYLTNPGYLPLMRVGDLVVSQVAPGISYPAYEIPEGTPQQPLRLAAPMANPNPGSVPVNTNKDSDGLVLSICNDSTSQAHTVRPVSVRVASFTPHTGALVAWNPCADGTYEAQAQALGPGGCGGGYDVNEYLHAAFPGSATTGATVTASQSSTSPAGLNDPNPFPGLPLSLAPGHSLSVSVLVTVPTTPGTYTFAFGLAVDSAAPVYFSTSAPTLYAPITTHWSGQNCIAPPVKSQIPAATQPTYYICPPAQ